MSKHQLLLNRREMSIDLKEGSNRWLMDISPNATPFTEEEMLPIVDSLIQESVDSRMAWLSTRLNRTHDLIGELLGKFENMHNLVDDFYHELIMDLELNIDNTLNELIPSKTWNVWYIRTLLHTTILEEGSDYRVLDWQRRMESGEWERE